MGPLTVIVEGSTESLRFQMTDAGTPIGLSSITVVLLLTDRLGTAVVTTGMVAVEDAANGIVSLTPATTGMFSPALSPYHARWQLTDALGAVMYVPSGARDLWYIEAK